METLEKLASAKRGWPLERRAAALERFLAKHQTWVLTLWSLAYFAGTALRARGKPFWADEILTLLEARQPSLSAAVHVLNRSDWMPPASRAVFYLTNMLLGSGEIAFRIPSMIGFWAFCLCLFFFARRRVTFYFAMTATLLPFATMFQKYSYEARSYALMLGFCGVALVSWQAATENPRRNWSLAGLALSLAAAISLQYWAVLIYLPLAGAQASRDFQRRRIDWPIWIVLAAGGAPLFLSIFEILHGLKAWHTWRMTQLQEYILFYKDAFANLFYFTFPAALLLAAWFALGGSKPEPEGAAPASVPAREWLAAALFFLIPVAAISIVLVMPPHVFTERYAIPFVAGFALLASFLAAHVARRRAGVGLALVLAALAPFGFLMLQPDRFEDPFLETAWLKARLENGPVVVDDKTVAYLQLWYYTPDALKHNLLFLSHEQETGSSEFREVGIPVVVYHSLIVPGNEFWIYASRFGELQRAILAHGGTLSVEKSARTAELLLAHMK